MSSIVQSPKSYEDTSDDALSSPRLDGSLRQRKKSIAPSEAALSPPFRSSQSPALSNASSPVANSPRSPASGSIYSNDTSNPEEDKSPISVNATDFLSEASASEGGPAPNPSSRPRTLCHRILYPSGISAKHRKYEHWVGRVGFGAKGLVYGFVGGMVCVSARRVYGNVNGSPQGAFVLIGTFPAGTGLLVAMLASLGCYIAWRWWECFEFQGADATFSPFKNFFAYRLSPFVSGCVYIAYSYYIIQVIAHDNKPSCYPGCWRDTTIGKIGLALFGVAFAIAAFTQLLNALTKKWHPEINWPRCNTFEKYFILGFGHVGFLGRTGLFLYVSVLMFRSFRNPIPQTAGNTIGNGVNQFVDTRVGRAFMWITGLLTIAYAVFALACTRYRYFHIHISSLFVYAYEVFVLQLFNMFLWQLIFDPFLTTPPPSGQPLFAHPKSANGTELSSVTVDHKKKKVVNSDDKNDLGEEPEQVEETHSEIADGGIEEGARIQEEIRQEQAAK